jgi:hypothetical protein
MLDLLGEDQLRLCYSESRKHCIQRHFLREADTTWHVHLDLENWLLTLSRVEEDCIFLADTRRSFRSVLETVHATLPCRTMRYFRADRNMTRRMTEYGA